MKRTALILAGAVAFDLGVMAVAAQAQQAGDPPPSSSGTNINEGLITNTNSKFPTQPSTGTVSPGPRTGGTAVWDPTGTGGCTPGSPLSGGTANPCAPGAIGGQITDQAAQGNLSLATPTAGGDGPRDHKGDSYTYFKIDRVNTLQSCRARQGEVVRHEGAQQCRIPPQPPAAVGNPTLNSTRRPGGTPPR
jgi:hypothetical protein